jgi:hypothetical protein
LAWLCRTSGQASPAWPTECIPHSTRIHTSLQALPDEPWGIYSARDTAWTAGSLAAVASQFAPLAAAGSADVGLVGYANLAPDAAELAQYNVLVLSRAFLNRLVGWFVGDGRLSTPA